MPIINCAGPNANSARNTPAEIADIVSKYAKYNGIRKPDLLNPTVFSLVNYREAERFAAGLGRYRRPGPEVERIICHRNKRTPITNWCCIPLRPAAIWWISYIAAGRNALFAKQGRASANAEAALVRALFKKDQDLSDYYNNVLAGGKWHHMMDQTHIGYTSWAPPNRNIMPRVTELTLAGHGGLRRRGGRFDFGVAGCQRRTDLARV